MKAHRIISGLSIAMLMLIVAACQQPYHQPEERYVLVAANVNLPYWQEAAAGLTDIGKTTGVKVEMVGPASFSPSSDAAYSASARRRTCISTRARHA